MRILTLCIIMTGPLATSMLAAGCGEASMDERGESDGVDDGSCADGPCTAAPEQDEPCSPEAYAAARGQGQGCPAFTKGTVATHIVVPVSWPGSLVLASGQGDLHIWTKVDLSVRGDALTGTARACGNAIPPFTKAALIGGGQVQIQIPGSVWDAPTMPTFPVQGTMDGSDVGAVIAIEPTASLVGLRMDNPLTDPWPTKAAQIRAVDDDGDGRPGIRAVPRTDSPFSAPPVDLGGVLDPKGPRADQLDLAIRVVMTLTGKRDTCSSAVGTAQVSRVDTQVVGCHIRGGGNCTAAQRDLINAAQPKFNLAPATFEMVQIPSKATCADVRAALPAR